MLRKPKIIFLIVLRGAVLGAALIWFSGCESGAAPEARKENQQEASPGHDRAGKPDEHQKEQAVRLSEAEKKEFGIEVGTAGPGNLKLYVTLPGEIVLNADRRVHIVPRVAGVVQQVRKTLGDQVRAGEIMAVLESRDLADMKSAYLAANERVVLAEVTFKREENLWKKKIAAEQDYLQAKQALAEAKIELRSAEQKLHALGFSHEHMAQLPTQPGASFTRYTITAPFDGAVIEKHITLGEVLKDDSTAFVVADLRSVWVDLRVYQKELPFVRRGQPVVLSAGRGIPDIQGKISYVGPLVGEQTRTALARVVLPNPDGQWRPGLFVTGTIVVENVDTRLLIPKSALQTIEERPAVFVETAEGVKPRHVTLGRSNDTHIEITSGLSAGERYVTRGTFTVKAQLSKGAFGGGHGH
ncbi:MAG: efflux RND transporter periplasmic adaptor subunit [Candidatus Binatia bacterium]